MLLSTLASSLTARRYDLAVLRVLGASPQRLSSTVVAEGLVLSGAGSVMGLIAGHLVAYGMTSMISSLSGIASPVTLLAPQPWDAGFLAIGLGAGLVAGLVPAASAARTDIAGLLARGRA